MQSFAEDTRAQRLLVEVDKNLWASTKYVDGRLIIDNGRRVRTLSMESWMEGVTKSYSYYKAPARERGTKMLKLEKKLWMYTPHTDRKILIAGHLLRQSMMGSDLSYEDMMEDEKISEAYIGTIDGEEEVGGGADAGDDPQSGKENQNLSDPQDLGRSRQEHRAQGGGLCQKRQTAQAHSLRGIPEDRSATISPKNGLPRYAQGKYKNHLYVR